MILNLIFSLLLFSGSLVAQKSSFVAKTLRTMTLNQKIGQLLMIPIYGDFYSSENAFYRDVEKEIKKYHVGGLVLFGGTPYATAFQLNEFQKLAKYPILVSSDFERGVFQQQPNGTHFPTNMAIGATRNKRFAYTQGEITAKEAISIGVHMVLGPVLDVNNNAKNPIINYRSYGEEPGLVSAFGVEMIRGLQDHGVIATAKHFPGHGDTDFDSHTGLPVIDLDLDRLEEVEFFPFKEAVDNGVKAIMTAHIAIPQLHDNKLTPATTSKVLLTDILRNKWGFKGIVISDAFNMRGINPNGMSASSIINAVNAGVDIILMPMNTHFAFNTIKKAVNRKKISMKTINESVRRIIQAKYDLGLFDKENRYVDLAKIKDNLEQNDFKKESFKIAKKSVTWLRNEDFPSYISKKSKILNISLSSERSMENPGKSFYYRLRRFFKNTNRIIIDHRTDELLIPKFQKMANEADVIIISIFSRTRGGKETLGIDCDTQAFLEEVIHGSSSPKLAISFGSPYIASDFSDIPNHITAYSYSTLMQLATAEALADPEEISGVSPVKVPFISEKLNVESDLISVKAYHPLYANDFSKLDSVMNSGLLDSVFPGASIILGSSDQIFYQKAYGKLSYDDNSPKVKKNTIYDLASVTKMMATNISVMKLISQGKLGLENRLGDILSEYEGTEKADIKIKHLLTHTAGLLWHRNFFETVTSKEDIYKEIYNEPLVTEIEERTKYSDLGFILLMQIIEQITGYTLDEYVKTYFYDPMNLDGIMYNPPKKLWSSIPPTEAVEWRGKMAQGEVHDENAMSIGGVSGHAGLFSNTKSLAAIAQMLMNGGTYKGRNYINESVIEQFAKPNGLADSGWGIGWMKASARSMTGRFVSIEAFGHSGYTGTSIWMDPKRDIFMILLSNRVHPTRDNKKIGQFRPKFHDVIMQTFGVNEFRQNYIDYLDSKK